MLKVQDTMPTHACRASQRLALAALEGLGEAWVREQVATLEPARAMLWEALAPLRGGGDALQPAGAFYYFVRLPGCSSRGARVLGEGGEGGEAAEEERSGLLHTSRLTDCEAEEEAVRRPSCSRCLARPLGGPATSASRTAASRARRRRSRSLRGCFAPRRRSERVGARPERDATLLKEHVIHIP